MALSKFLGVKVDTARLNSLKTGTKLAYWASTNSTNPNAVSEVTGTKLMEVTIVATDVTANGKVITVTPPTTPVTPTSGTCNLVLIHDGTAGADDILLFAPVPTPYALDSALTYVPQPFTDTESVA